MSTYQEKWKKAKVLFKTTAKVKKPSAVVDSYLRKPAGLDKTLGKLDAADKKGINLKVEALKEFEAAYKEFNRMLTASLRYAAENKKEVAEAVAKSSNVSTEFLINVLDGIATFKTPVEEGDLKALDYFWNAAKDVGLLKTAPPAPPLAWPPAMQP